MNAFALNANTSRRVNELRKLIQTCVDNNAPRCKSAYNKRTKNDTIIPLIIILIKWCKKPDTSSQLLSKRMTVTNHITDHHYITC